MCDKIVKPIDDPNHISILLPTHGRPQMLANLLASLGEKTYNKKLVDVWLYIDFDDFATIDWLKGLPGNYFGLKVIPFFGPPPKTMGMMANTLWKNSTNAGIYLPCADDFIFLTDKWDELLRTAYNSYPDRLVLFYFTDPLNPPGQVTWFTLSAEWANKFGRIITEYFPFWFDDTWLDEIAIMIQRKEKIQIEVQPQGGKGKTKRMRNVPFWFNFFFCTLFERVREADILRKAIYGENTDQYFKSLEDGEKCCEAFKKHYSTLTMEILKSYESLYADRGSLDNHRKILQYANAESKALNHLANRLEELLEKDLYSEAIEVLDTMALSMHKYNSIYYYKSHCLYKLNHLHKAEIVLLKGSSSDDFNINYHRLLKEIRDKISKANLLNQQGEELFNLGDIDNAIEKFKLAINISSDFVSAYNNLGVAFFKKGDYINALESIKMALVINPTDEIANENLKEMLEKIELL